MTARPGPGKEPAKGLAIIVSGLPASGKTTIGLALARAFGLPSLDKDDFLEQRYETEGLGDWPWRQRLSRLSDGDFQTAAAQLDCAVLISHWRPRGGPKDTGTPTDWLGEAFGTLVEVYCAISPEIAAQRFLARRRHPGHLDEGRDPNQVRAWMRGLAEGYPLGLGDLIEVSADSAFDLSDLANRVRARRTTEADRRG